MKTITVISFHFLLLLNINTIAQTYHPLPTQNAYWTVYEWDELNRVYDDKVYSVDGDTLINELQYTKVYKLNDYPTIYDTVRTLHCFMRQDNQAKKIWFIRYYLGETSEKLGYDLSVAVGDTISLPAFDYGNVGDSVYVRSESPSGDSVMINDGTYRRQYFLHPISYSDNIIQFIEGVTNYTTTFPNKYYSFDPFHQTYTQCVEINKNFNWPIGQDSTSCGFNFVYVYEKSAHNINCHPNPAYNYTYIEFTSTSYWSILGIYDLVGNRLKEIKLIPGTNQYTINLTEFPSGIYLLELKTPASKYYNKLIINH